MRMLKDAFDVLDLRTPEFKRKDAARLVTLATALWQVRDSEE